MSEPKLKPLPEYFRSEYGHIGTEYRFANLDGTTIFGTFAGPTDDPNVINVMSVDGQAVRISLSDCYEITSRQDYGRSRGSQR